MSYRLLTINCFYSEAKIKSMIIDEIEAVAKQYYMIHDMTLQDNNIKVIPLIENNSVFYVYDCVCGQVICKVMLQPTFDGNSIDVFIEINFNNTEILKELSNVRHKNRDAW